LQLLATGVVSHREELIKIREGTALSVRSLVNFGVAAMQTNKQGTRSKRREIQKLQGFQWTLVDKLQSSSSNWSSLIGDLLLK
jgi:hypothetical protein